MSSDSYAGLQLTGTGVLCGGVAVGVAEGKLNIIEASDIKDHHHQDIVFVCGINDCATEINKKLNTRTEHNGHWLRT